MWVPREGEERHHLVRVPQSTARGPSWGERASDHPVARACSNVSFARAVGHQKGYHGTRRGSELHPAQAVWHKLAQAALGPPSRSLCAGSCSSDLKIELRAGLLRVRVELRARLLSGCEHLRDFCGTRFTIGGQRGVGHGVASWLWIVRFISSPWTDPGRGDCR